VSLDVKVDSARLQRLFKLAPNELKQAVTATAGNVGKRFIGYHRARRLRGPPGVRGTRRGFLSRNLIDYTVKGTTLNNVVLDIRTKSRIPAEHETGKEILARDGKSLLVPMPQNGKFPTRAQLRRARGLAKAGKLIRIDAKDGKTYLGERRGRRGLLRLLFVLLKKVKMKPRLAFYATWREFKSSGQARKLFYSGISFAINAARRKARAG